jgi:hypothetical protein
LDDLNDPVKTDKNDKKRLKRLLKTLFLIDFKGLEKLVLRFDFVVLVWFVLVWMSKFGEACVGVKL